MKKLKLMAVMLFAFLSINIYDAQAQVYDNQPATNGQIQEPPITDDTYFDDDLPQQQAQPQGYPQQQPGYPQQQPQSSMSYEPFYNDLAPYGTWRDYPGYGYVWIPSVEMGFRPYATNGHWVMTNYGWTWASNYQWGWAAFHYGRWTYESRYGWMWIPGSTWGPAWVSWRQNDQYYGWAPLGPHRAGVSISVGIPVDHYCFAPIRYMTQPLLAGYIVNRGQNNVIISNTIVVNNARVVNNRKIIYGPERNHYEHISGQRISTLSFRESQNARIGAVNNGHYDIYRPQMSPNRVNSIAARPNRVESDRNIHPQNQSQNQSQRTTPTVQHQNQSNGNGGGRQRDNGVRQQHDNGRKQHDNGGKRERRN